MEKDFKEYIKELNIYKEKHHFKYSEIADMLDTTTRSLRRWLKDDYMPLPVYQKKILKLLKKENL